MTGLPLTGPSGPAVPVFDCHVLLRKPSQPGERFAARCARAPHVQATGTTERETLQQIYIRFKYFLTEHQSQGQAVPWHDPPCQPEPGEVERWIPIHL
jgi:hypothetical protein